MLLEIYIFFQALIIIGFVTAFFTKQEIIWGITIILTAILMFSSYNVENYVYQFNNTMSAYQPVIITHSYPYLVGINLVFFGLGVILMIFDIFDKYGSKFVNNLPKK